MPRVMGDRVMYHTVPNSSSNARCCCEDHYGGSGSFLLKAVPPTLGLRPRDVEELRDWAVALTL